MKISNLFTAYNDQLGSTPNSTAIFTEAGMTTASAKLQFGFFPLGSGILTNESNIAEAQIEEGGTMVLGHDFGTVSYVNDKCKDGRENNSRTIQNLADIGLDIECTFFTNLYLGLRDDSNQPNVTMTSTIKRTSDYKKFCLAFFKTQLELINPKLVICLGKEVGRVLPQVFKKLTEPGKSLLSLYADENLTDYIVHTNDKIFGRRKFVIIPHPSYAHINWAKHDIKAKIKDAIKIKEKSAAIDQKIPTMWNGYCPESWMKGKTVIMKLNNNDFYESEGTGLQICVIAGVQAIILKFRGVGDFRQNSNTGHEIETGEILSPQTTDSAPFNDGVIFKDSETIATYIAAIT